MPGTGTRSRTRPVRVKPRNKAPHSARSSSRRRLRITWKTRLILFACFLIADLLAWAIVARYTAPTANTSLTRFDAIIVLGSPADRDGNPTPLQLSRVLEAVHEYERGVAPRLIFTGGPTRKGFVEAAVMARTARAEGIPETSLVIEGQALDTIQNACYAVRIMNNHGWHSAEVLSTASHLPRAGMIFDRMPIEWRTHAAPRFMDGSPQFFGILPDTLETLKTVRYLVWSRQMEQCEP